MAAFRYQAIDASGRIVKGVLEADSERSARASLRAKQCRPLDIKPTTVSSAKWSVSWFKPRLSPSEVALVTRQLATLVASSLPLDQCLQAVADQTRRASTKGLLLQIRAKVAEGYTLANALAQFPQTFNDMYRAMVSAGEQAGQLGPVLEQLATYTEERQYTAQQLKMALIYPFVLVGVAIAVVTALMVFVVPELVGIFAHSKRELPPLTVGLIATSDFLREFGLTVFIVLVVCIWGLKQFLRNPDREFVWHRWLLRLPMIGALQVSMDTARFASTLSILMASGVPLLDALRIAGAVMQNRVLKQSSNQVALRVSEGSSLHKALSNERFFPPMMVHMVASGETSGDLEAMLARSASNQERELQMTLGTVMALFEPAMVVVMGSLVLIIVLAILLPIFDLNTMVK